MKEETFGYAEDIVSKAVMFAVAAHSGQYRKDGTTPAVIHAMEAATVAATMTGDPDVMAAALLHDTIEDTDVTAEQVLRMFGEKVSALVGSETEDKHREMSAEDSWVLRKQESLEVLKNETDINAKILWLSDKLSNMRAFYRYFRDEGDQMWRRFHQHDPQMHAWYYREIARLMPELKDTAAYEEYVQLVNKVFGKDEER